LTFKDLKKKVSLELTQQPSAPLGCRINHFGFGISKNINSRISEQMESAALTILLVYLPREG